MLAAGHWCRCNQSRISGVITAVVSPFDIYKDNAPPLLPTVHKWSQKIPDMRAVILLVVSPQAGPIWRKKYDMYLCSLAHATSAKWSGRGLRPYTAASHQGAIKTFWCSCLCPLYTRPRHLFMTFSVPFSTQEWNDAIAGITKLVSIVYSKPWT